MNQKFIDRYKVLKDFGDKPDRQIAQQRGLDFEALINEITLEEGNRLSKSYYADGNNSEQIDGAIEVYNRIFLIEVKWLSSDEAASELYSFIGKIENKFNGTLGVFISKKKLSDNFVTALNRGRRQSVLIVHGDDIDQLFTPDGPLLKDYLEYCFKLLSYRNMTHFPVADYIKFIHKPKLLQSNVASQTVANTVLNRPGINFINNNLITGSASPSALQMAYGLLDENEQKYVLDYAVKQWQKVHANWMIMPYGKDQTFNNLSTFFRSLDAKTDVVKSISEDFYLKYLKENFGAYGVSPVVDPFIQYFGDLPEESINEVGSVLVQELIRVEGNWDAENQITDFISFNWKLLSEEVKKEFKQLYLDIFVSSSRQDRFAQKSFAIKLMKEGQTTKDEIEIWLRSKLRKMKTDYQGEDTEGLIKWAFNAYYPIMPYLNLHNAQEFEFLIRKMI